MFNQDNQESRVRERWLRPNEPAGTVSPAAGRRRRHKRQVGQQPGADSDDIDDGEEGGWVNDGVDDISIDPETQRAASEHSYGLDKNLDAEYEPEVANRTRVTTITEVIPISLRPSDDQDDQDERQDSADDSSVNSRYLAAPAAPLAAAQLSLQQAQRLVALAAGR